MFFSDCVIYAEYTSSDPSKIIVNYDSGSDRSMGEISISPIGQNFLKGPPIQGDYFLETAFLLLLIRRTGTSSMDGILQKGR